MVATIVLMIVISVMGVIVVQGLCSKGPFQQAITSLGAAQLIISSTLGWFLFSTFSAGALFGLLRWRTGNLGAGLGLHFGVYLMFGMLAWEPRIGY